MGLHRQHCTNALYCVVLAASLVTSAAVREDDIDLDRKWILVGASATHVAVGTQSLVKVKVESGYPTRGGGDAHGNAKQRAVEVEDAMKTQGENKDGVLASLPRWRDEKESSAHGQLAEQHIRVRRRAVKPNTQAGRLLTALTGDGNVTVTNTTSPNNGMDVNMTDDSNTASTSMVSTSTAAAAYIAPHMARFNDDTNLVLVVNPVASSRSKLRREIVDKVDRVISRLRLSISRAANRWCAASPRACCPSTSIGGRYDPSLYPLLDPARIQVVAGPGFAQNGSRLYHAGAVPAPRNALCAAGTPAETVSDTPIGLDANMLLKVILPSRDVITSGLRKCCDVELGAVYPRVVTTSMRHRDDVTSRLPEWVTCIIVTLVILLLSLCLAALITHYINVKAATDSTSTLQRAVVDSPPTNQRHERHRRHGRHRHHHHNNSGRRHKHHHHHHRRHNYNSTNNANNTNKANNTNNINDTNITALLNDGSHYNITQRRRHKHHFHHRKRPRHRIFPPRRFHQFRKHHYGHWHKPRRVVPVRNKFQEKRTNRPHPLRSLKKLLHRSGDVPPAGVALPHYNGARDYAYNNGYPRRPMTYRQRPVQPQWDMPAYDEDESWGYRFDPDEDNYEYQQNDQNYEYEPEEYIDERDYAPNVDDYQNKADDYRLTTVHDVLAEYRNAQR